MNLYICHAACLKPDGSGYKHTFTEGCAVIQRLRDRGRDG